MNPYAAQLYIDGSCLKNPGGAGGFAGILEIPEQEGGAKVIFQEGYKSTTNNRMEIRALIRAMEYVKENSSYLKSLGVYQVEIRSDSTLTIGCFKNAEGWRSTWTGLDGKPISNVDLIKRILTLKNTIGLSYSVEHVLNKSTEQTRRVDKLAKAAAKKPTKDDSGYIKPRASRTAIRGGTTMFDAQGQKLKIKIFEHCPVSRRKSSLFKVKFEVMTGDNSGKFFAYCSQGVNDLLHRHHYYNANFNVCKNNAAIERVKVAKKQSF